MKRCVRHGLYALAAVAVALVGLAGVVAVLLFREPTPEESAWTKAEAAQREAVRAEAQRLRAREIFLHYFDNDPDDVAELDGFCHFWLDAGECRLGFESDAEIVLEEAWRYSPVSCAALRDPMPIPDHDYACLWDAERGLSRCCSTTLIRDLTANTYAFWEATCDFACPSRSRDGASGVDRAGPGPAGSKRVD